VQYRQHLMPLVPFTPEHQWKTRGRQEVLVFADNGRSMGLAVDEVVGIDRGADADPSDGRARELVLTALLEPLFG
jgi:hypothetical protein